MKKLHKVMTYCMIGTLALASRNAITQAAELPIAGMDIVLNDFYENNNDADNEITQYLASIYTGISFANVNNYVNIRSEADEESKILGKLYQNSAATVLGEENGWYKVKSGKVTGYIKSDYLIIGEKAEKLSKELGTKIATVNASALKLRQDTDTNSKILTLLPSGEKMKVLKELDGWVKVTADENVTGFVASDYVELKTEFKVAISIEEEKAKIAAEKSAKKTSSSSSSSRKTISSLSTSSNNSSSGSLRSKIVNYALRFEGNPYVWGGTSLTNGADCSGFTQSVLEDFGIYIPRTSRAQASSGRRVSLDDIRKGDLVFYTKNGRINHVALYIGNGQVISAKSRSQGIQINNLYYRTPYKAVTYID